MTGQLDEQTQLEVDLYRSMLQIRITEEMLAELYKEQEMRTPTHFAIGQEAVAAGICHALSPVDVVYSGHRSHAHYLAKGGGIDDLVAELYGKETGSARGRGGSVHLTDRSVGFIATSAILAQMIPVAVGSALAFSLDSEKRVAVSFFGDGSTDEGVFGESINFAAVHRLPVIMVCENNLYSTSTPLSIRRTADISISERAAAFGIRAITIDGYDPIAVYEAANEARKSCLSGNGPVLIECLTYRWREHVGPYEDYSEEYDVGYRTREEAEAWKAKDPIKRLGLDLIAAGVTTQGELDDWTNKIVTEVDAAVIKAKSSPFPPVSDLYDDVH
jgi:pyruvate dehydrogenase E1 component alpha subunit